MYLVHSVSEAQSFSSGKPVDSAGDDAGTAAASALTDLLPREYALAADAGDELADRKRRLQLARVLKVTGQMIAHAKQKEWQQVEELELLRRIEIEECFSSEGHKPSALVAEAMATLMYLNDQLVTLVGYARGQLSDAHDADNRAFTAVRAYEEMR